jgi:transcription termination factor Rho
MHLAELKAKTPADLLAYAESLQIENASSLRKQDMMFAILKTLADNDQAIHGEGNAGNPARRFGFLRSPEANYLPGPDDIYISPSQVRRFGLRTGDTVEGQIRAPRDGERYFALLKVNTINFEPPEAVRHRINFDNLTPLYPERRLKMEVESDAGPRSARQGRQRQQGADQGFHPACDRPGLADRHGPARPDRRAAAHRQDRDAAKHRLVHLRQPSESS